MSFLKSSMPSPPPRDDSAQRKAAEDDMRLRAEREELAQSKAYGRRSTIAAGGTMAFEEQQLRGQASQARRTLGQ